MDPICPSPDTFVFIFYNPRSGNRQGKHLQKVAGQFFRLKEKLNVQIQMYNLINAKENSEGFVCLLQMYNTYPDATFHVWSAGGDGTFVGVLESFKSLQLSLSDQRINFCVFGFGTGNDLPQALNWGRAISLKHTENLRLFAPYIMERLNGKIRQMDIWKLKVTSYNNGGITKISKEMVKKPSMERMMSNYMTLGLQGLVGSGFEKNRHTSRLLNIFEYVKQSFVLGCLAPMERLSLYFKRLVLEDSTSFVLTNDKKNARSVELLVQNIPGIWGRQVDLWNTCKLSESVLQTENEAIVNNDPTKKENWTYPSISDSKLEVFSIKSRMDYLLKQAPCTRKSALARLGQFSDKFTIEFKENSKFHLMVDGEFYLLENVASLEISLVDKIKIIEKNIPA